MRTNVLFVSIAFPPKNDPEALQAGRYFRHLVRADDLAVDVLTSRDPTLWMPADPSLAVAGHRQRVELPIFEPRYLSVALIATVPQLCLLPDLRMSFHLQWWRVPRLLEHRPDVIYSRCYPLSSNIMARRLARHYRVPWIMHMSDPWVAPGFPRYRGFAERYNLAAERRCLSEATRVTFASPRIMGIYAARYPDLRAKYSVANNVFDDTEPTGPPPPSHTGARLRLVYTGSMDEGRCLKYLFEALRRVRATDAGLLERLEVEVAGQADAVNLKLLRSGEFPCVRYHGHVAFPKARELQRSADLLHLVDNPLRAEDAVYVPSKLLDYMVTGNPIVGVTTPGSMTTEVLTPELGAWFAHEDTTGFARYLVERLRAFAPGQPRTRTPPVAAAQFAPEYNAQRLQALIRELLGARGRA